MAVFPTSPAPNFLMIENYIYLYHVNQYIILPAYADSVQDNQSVTFNPSNLLSRSAPIYSYSHSGPRQVQVAFNLHRDLMYQINKENNIPGVTPQNDYVDLFIKYIQASVLPTYEVASKMVNPPIVALRLGNDIYIKGVIVGGLGLTYGYPILSNGRYANVSITFTIAEIDPFDAKQVMKMGSFRKVSTSLDYSSITAVGDNGYNASGEQGRSATNSTTKAVNSNSNKQLYGGEFIVV